jgi:hypothetical protein
MVEMGIYESLKKVWKKLGIGGQVKNFSSVDLWVIENESGPVARRLPPGFKTPVKVDVDGFKRFDGIAIDGHKNWWKIYDVSTAEIYDAKKSLRVSAITKRAVEEVHFGKPTYLNEVWGSPIQVITDVKRDKKKRITQFLVSNVGWVDVEQALKMTCRHEIDNARPVFPEQGKPYIRTRRDPELFNNISAKGKVT